MRFHVGFSFRLRDLKKLIIPILIVIGVFFGLEKVNAETLTYSSVNSRVVYSNCNSDFSVCTDEQSPIYSVPTNNQIILNYPTFSIQNSPFSYNSITNYSGISQIVYELNGITLVANNQYRVKVNMNFSSTDGIRRIFNQNKITTCTTSGTTCKNYSYKAINNNSFYLYFTPSVNSTKIYFVMSAILDTNSENNFLIYNKGLCTFSNHLNGFCSNNYNNIIMNFTAPIVELVSEDPIQGGLNNVDNSINNQTQLIQDKFDEMFNLFSSGNNETNNKLDNIEDTITDDSIDDNTGFFTDFEEKDFGLSDIVKAPLILIRGLSNGNTCQDLEFNVLGADVTIPSGCILWELVPESVETIYFVFVGGFFAYMLGTKLFHDVNDLKDPEKNEVSTIEL